MMPYGLRLPPPADAPDLFTLETNACGTYSLTFASATAGAVVVRCSDYVSTPSATKSWLYTTADGGANWAGRPLPLPYGTLAFANANIGWWLGAPGTDGTGNELFQTKDGGATWASLRKMNWGAQLDFLSELNGFGVAQAGSAYALVKTTTGGQKWAEIKPVITP